MLNIHKKNTNKTFKSRNICKNLYSNNFFLKKMNLQIVYFFNSLYRTERIYSLVCYILKSYGKNMQLLQYFQTLLTLITMVISVGFPINRRRVRAYMSINYNNYFLDIHRNTQAANYNVHVHLPHPQHNTFVVHFISETSDF